MEKFFGKFPCYGKIFLEISIPWKKFFQNFHAMEIFRHNFCRDSLRVVRTLNASLPFDAAGARAAMSDPTPETSEALRGSIAFRRVAVRARS
jgi:hypothetical protein